MFFQKLITTVLIETLIKGKMKNPLLIMPSE